MQFISPGLNLTLFDYIILTVIGIFIIKFVAFSSRKAIDPYLVWMDQHQKLSISLVVIPLVIFIWLIGKFIMHW